MDRGQRRLVFIVIGAVIGAVLGFLLLKVILGILVLAAVGAVCGAIGAYIGFKDPDKVEGVVRAVEKAAAPVITRNDAGDYQRATLDLAKCELLSREAGFTADAIRQIQTVSDALVECLPDALDRFDTGSSERHEIRQIPSYHLPKLLKEYAELTPDQRAQREGALLESLRRMKAEIDRIAGRAADANDIDFGTRQRVTEQKYTL